MLLQSLLEHFWVKGEKIYSQVVWGGLWVFNSHNSVFSMVWNNRELTDRKKKKCIRSVSQAPTPAIPHKTFATGSLGMFFNPLGAHHVPPLFVAEVSIWIFFNFPFPLSYSNRVYFEGVLRCQTLASLSSLSRGMLLLIIMRISFVVTLSS